MLRIFLAMSILMVSSPTFAGTALSDSEARSIAEDRLKILVYEVPIGQFAVVSGDTDLAKGTASSKLYNILVNWEKVGLLAVLEDQAYENFRSGKGFSINQWMQLTQEGVQKKIVVTVTERGRQYLTASPREQLRILLGKFTVTKIVKNEERRKGVDEYRLIMLTYDADWNQDVFDFKSASGTPVSERRKMVMLLKYDPFQSKWKWFTWDLANADEEFKTDQVARALAQ